MSNWNDIKGVALLGDVQSLAPGYLTGGRNLVKRGRTGVIRRPNYGRYDDDVAPSTNPKAAFQWRYFGGSRDVIAFADGSLYRHNPLTGAYDLITLGMVDARPTYESFLQYGLIASGGPVLKYGDDNTPHPLGSILLTDFEEQGGFVEVQGDVLNKSAVQRYSGTLSQELQFSSGITVGELEFYPEYSEGIGDVGTPVVGFGEARVGWQPGALINNHTDWGSLIDNDSGATINFNSVKFHAEEYGTFVGDVTVEVYAVDGSNQPTGPALGTGTLLNANIPPNGVPADVEVTLDQTVSWTDGQRIVIIWTGSVQTSGNSMLLYAPQYLGDGIYDINKAAPPWQVALDQPYHPWVQVREPLGFDMYTGYADGEGAKRAKIKFAMRCSEPQYFRTLTNYVRFVDINDNYVQYDISDQELTDADETWLQISITRGDVNGIGGSWHSRSASDPDFREIVKVVFLFTNAGTTDYIHLDNMFLLGPYAPPDSDKVFVSNDRIWVLADNEAHYSLRNIDDWWYDQVSTFPSDCIAVSSAGPYTLVHTEYDTWASPQVLEGYPDFDFMPVSTYGCVSKNAAGKMKYKGAEGAFWVSRSGVRFFPAAGGPDIPISDAIRPVFLGGATTDTPVIDWSRADEIVCVYHPAWQELWMFFPTSGDSAGSFRYAWVLDCNTGEWMPPFYWHGTYPLNFASAIIRNGQYKLLVRDTFNNISAEDEAGNNPESNVASYADSWFVQGENDEEQKFTELSVKMRPRTTSQFDLEVRTRLATAIDKIDTAVDIHEADIVYPDAFGSDTQMDRSITSADVDNQYVKFISIPDDQEGHGISFRIGQISGGTAEYELGSIKVAGSVEGGPQ